MSEKPELRPDLAVAVALRAFARDALTEARTALLAPTKSDATAVHDFRRAMKRWRSLLRLLDPFLGQSARALRTRARDLARELAVARDAQSALDALGDIGDHALSPRVLAGLRQRIVALRHTAESTVLTPHLRARLTAAIDDAEAAVAQWPLNALTFADVAEQLTRSFRQTRRAIPRAWPEATAEQLHDLRKRVVSLRYQITLAEPLWPRYGRMWAAEAQRLRDRLGRHHDLLVLARLTAPQQPLARWRARLAPAIAHRQAEHVASARRSAARLFVEKPKVFRERLVAMWRASS
jgi:CHAD domain-containing protein